MLCNVRSRTRPRCVHICKLQVTTCTLHVINYHLIINAIQVFRLEIYQLVHDKMRHSGVF